MGRAVYRNEMLSDKERVEENTRLLQGRWAWLRACALDGERLGMDPEAVELICSLDERQVARAADCAAPLFALAHDDEVILQALVQEGVGQPPFAARDALDSFIEQENEFMLLNRWSAARMSPVYCQCVLGMSVRLTEAFREATVTQVQKASRMGLRLVGLACRPRYFFHAGLNFGLQRSNRTVLAVCGSSSLGL